MASSQAGMAALRPVALGVDVGVPVLERVGRVDRDGGEEGVGDALAPCDSVADGEPVLLGVDWGVGGVEGATHSVPGAPALPPHGTVTARE